MPTPGQHVADAPSRQGELARRLSRSVSREPVEPYLDGVRAVAVLSVFTLHCWLRSGRPAGHLGGVDLSFIPFAMDWGVDLFFVLSGFLLARPWFRAELGLAPRPRLTRYWARRLSRILPAYYLSVIATLAVFSYFGPIRQEAIEGTVGFWHLGGLVLLIHRYLPMSAGMLNGPNGVWWTLTIEMTWYVILPLTVFAFVRRRWLLALPAAAAITVGWDQLASKSFGPLVDAMSRSLSWPTTWDTGFSNSESAIRSLLLLAIPSYTFTFAVGVALARLSVVTAADGRSATGAWQRHGAVPIAALTGGLTLLGLATYWVGAERVALGDYFLDPPWTLMLRATAIGLILLGLTTGPRSFRRPLEAGPLRYVGLVSYGVYLFHIPVLILLQDHARIQSFAVLYVVGGVVTLALATLSWVFVERPFLARSPSVRPLRSSVAIGLVAAAIGSYVWAIQQHNRPTRWTSIMAAHDTQDATAIRPAVHPMVGVAPSPDRSGPTTVAQAAATGLIGPDVEGALAACGASKAGSVIVAGKAAWQSVIVSFECRHQAAAEEFVNALNRSDAATGFVTESGRPVAHLRSKTRGPNERLPVTHHVRWNRGRVITNVTIFASDFRAERPDIADEAADVIVRSAGYPASD